MSKLSAFLRKGQSGTYGHWCPGCNELHYIAVERPFNNGARWSFDGNVNAPTFSPSVNIWTGGYRDAEVDIPEARCHYFLRAGKLDFCGDSTHELAGKSVDLPPLPDGL